MGTKIYNTKNKAHKGLTTKVPAVVHNQSSERLTHTEMTEVLADINAQGGRFHHITCGTGIVSFDGPLNQRWVIHSWNEWERVLQAYEELLGPLDWRTSRVKD
jgi:hypothetical protein